MYCYNCGNKLLGSETSCNLCGISFLVETEKNLKEEIIENSIPKEVEVTNSEPDRNKTEELKEENNNRSMQDYNIVTKRKPKIAIVSTVSILLVGIIVYFGITFFNSRVKRNSINDEGLSVISDDTDVMEEHVSANEEPSNEVETAEESQELYAEEESQVSFEDYYLIDYGILTKIIWQYQSSDSWNDVIEQCELIDGDKDGKKELYIVRKNEFWVGKSEVYGIGPYTNPVIAAAVDSSSSGGYSLRIDKDTGFVYLLYDVAYMTFYSAGYMNLTNEGWDDFAGMSYQRETTEENGEYVEHKYDERFSSRNRDITEEDFLNISEINGEYETLGNNKSDVLDIVIDENMDNLIKGFDNHLKELGVEGEKYYFDIDGDNEDEVIYAVNNYIQMWLDNICCINAWEDEERIFTEGYIPYGTELIVFDEKSEGKVNVDFCLIGMSDSKSIVYNDNLYIKDVYDNTVCYIYTPNDENPFTYYYTEEIEQNSEIETETTEEPLGHGAYYFYGIWCYASKDYESAQAFCDTMTEQGYDARVMLTTDWENLNPEPYYVVTSKIYEFLEDAEKALPNVQKDYPNAYIKYTGVYIGDIGF